MSPGKLSKTYADADGDELRVEPSEPNGRKVFVHGPGVHLTKKQVRKLISQLVRLVSQ